MVASDVPLRLEQIEAAQSIYERHTDGWRRIDGALAALADSMPDFDPSSVLLKTVVVNSLYSTNVYAVDRAALHVGDVLDGADRDLRRRPELVEKMAAIPPRPGDIARMCRSFASK